ncbi:hypothetical protein HPB50_006187 [Hyalomma asiaticum]|uniref:Uncharacterized protein n=1 Tax=Hyalomma asiaticum TaxID=266040 RepID=A0ACB7SBG2_HYAAI|nr:hypothetical protein HPB50_006187 [Hyalomma asiaticum]
MERLPFVLFQVALLVGSSLPSSATDTVFPCPLQNAGQSVDWTHRPYRQDRLSENQFFDGQLRPFTTTDTAISTNHTEYKLLPVYAPVVHDTASAMERLPFVLFQCCTVKKFKMKPDQLA